MDRRGFLFRKLVPFGFLILFSSLTSGSLASASSKTIAKYSPQAPEDGFPIADWSLDQTDPALAYNPSGDSYLAVVVNQLSGSAQITARQLAADGTPVTAYDLATAGAVSLAPDLAFNSLYGEYLVVWEHQYTAEDHDIYARRVASDGTPVSNVLKVSYSGEYESAPVVAYNSTDNEYVVAWVARVHLGGGVYQERISGQRVLADGTMSGSSAVIGYSPGDASAPDLAYSPTSQTYLLVWNGEDEGGDYDIFGQRVLENLVQVGSQIGVQTWEFSQYHPRLAYNPEQDEYISFWVDYHYNLAYPQVYGQRIAADGALISGLVIPGGQAAYGNLSPDVTFQPYAHGYLLVWDYLYNTADHDVYRMLLTGSGNVLEAAASVSRLPSNEKMPGVASNGSSQAVIVWEDSRSTANGVDIYGLQVTVQLPTFVGAVYEGQSGDTSTPLSDVTVELYCSNSENAYGEQLTSDTTGSDGVFRLSSYRICEYYNLVLSVPDGYLAIASDTISGVVRAADWLQYTGSLEGKTLTGNKFWVLPETPVDVLPPGNWTNFQPAGWTTSLAPMVSLQVQDVQSGLEINSAEFSFSTDSGSNWSSWQTAGCSGANGSTSPETVSAYVPFQQQSSSPSSNQARFRITDRATNIGESPAYPVKIDSVAPFNPGFLFSTDHTENSWSNNMSISFGWTNAWDSGSGLYGYSIAWDHSPTTVPDAFRDVENLSYSTYASAEGNDYYFHVRSIDVAGNAGDNAAHTGPYKFDTTAPIAAYLGPSGQVNTLTFTVSWGGSDSRSGVASFDVQTSPNNSSWTDWQMETTATSHSFTGVRGMNTYFRVRSRDQAGNLSSWAYSGQVHVGATVSVRVRDEAAHNAINARVYLDGEYMGLTNISGVLGLTNILLGDRLDAEYEVHERYSNKGSHSNYGSGDWAWKDYWTSVRVENSGLTTHFMVTDTSQYQDLVVRKNQGLVSFHILVSVEWDAEPGYMNALEIGLRDASEYLYDVTDGQFLWGKIEAFDNQQNWGEADVRIYADKDMVAHANYATGHWRGLGGVTAGTDMQIHMPGLYQGSNYTFVGAYRTFMHEFGHYGLWLADEYLDRDGNADGHCTTNFINNPSNDQEAAQGSIMYHQWDATELCSRVDPVHQHNTDTFQDEYNNGETTWETVVRHYSGAEVTIQTPDTRGATVPGPNLLPIPSWVQVDVTDNDTGACPTFSAGFVYTDNNQPVKDMSVWLLPILKSPMYQGKTNAQGEILILGAHNGDQVIAHKTEFLDMALVKSAYMPVLNCELAAPQPPAAGEPASFSARASIPVEPASFALQAAVYPLSETQVELRVKSSTLLPSPPTASLWQDGASEASAVPLVFNPGQGIYTGQAALDPALGLSGSFELHATDASRRSVTQFAPFSIDKITADLFTPYMRSADGLFELMVPPGSLDDDSLTTIQPVIVGPTQLGPLRQVGNAYQVYLSSGEYQLNGTCAANVAYPPALEAAIVPGTLQLYRWDAQAGEWLPAGSTSIDLARRLTSTPVGQLGVFALFALPDEGQSKIYLPVVRR